MTKAQVVTFRRLVEDINPTEFHHGDCVGADEKAHNIVRQVLADCTIFIHPPKNSSKRAGCEGDFVFAVKEYLERNKDIVNGTDRMIATPQEFEEQQRSGTWSTVRYAEKCGTIVYVILPDGLIRMR